MNKWSFRKADTQNYSQIIEQTIQRIPALPSSHDCFTNLVISEAKKSIPRGHREAYIPGWTEDAMELYEEFTASGDAIKGRELLKKLDKYRKKTWETKIN